MRLGLADGSGSLLADAGFWTFRCDQFCHSRLMRGESATGALCRETSIGYFRLV